MMSPKDLLGVLVRLVGLSFILFSLSDLYYVVVKTLGFQSGSQAPVWEDVLGFLFYLAFGLAILAGARWIVRLAYWRDGP